MTEILEALDWRGDPVRIQQGENGRWYTFFQVREEHRIAQFVSCTTVINKIFGPGFPPEAAAAAEHAGERGTQVHDAVKLAGIPIEDAMAAFHAMIRQTAAWDALRGIDPVHRWRRVREESQLSLPDREPGR